MFLTIVAVVTCALELHVVAGGAKLHPQACLTEADVLHVRELFYLRENLSSTEGVLSLSCYPFVNLFLNLKQFGERRGNKGST